MRRVPTAAAALLCALAASPAPSPAAGPLDKDYSAYSRNIIPSGQYGAVPVPAGADRQAKMYDALTPLFDKVSAGEAGGGEAFEAWAKVCKTDCIRSGIRMIAEREAYHSRVFAHRVAELGGEHRATRTEAGRKSIAYFGNPSIPDNEKLLRFTSDVGKPEDAIKPICEFAGLLKEDLSTKEALRLFAEDELSTAKWLWDSCAALNAPKKEASASATM